MSRLSIALLIACTALIVGFGVILTGPDREEAQSITVYKTPWCGCCTNWAKYIENEGFNVTIIEREDLTSVRQTHHVPNHLISCHTAVTDGYAIEGHVPAAEIRKILKDRPDANGLAVPGMPIGSPGMEQGDRKDTYDVILFGDGPDQIFASYIGGTPTTIREAK